VRVREPSWRRVRVRANRLFDLLTHDVKSDAEGVERLGGYSFTLADKSKQNVFRANEGVVKVTCFFLGEYEYSAGTVCKSLEQCSSFTS